MRLSKLGVFLVLPLLLTACAEEEPAVEETPGAVVVTPEPAPGMPPAGTPMDTGMAAMPGGMATQVQMNPVGNSGVSGQATVTPQGQQTQVMVSLNGFPPNTAHAGHIHTGTCASPGPVVVPLQEISAGADGSGSMTTTVQADPNTVMNGQHIIAYHESGAPNHGPPVVCGSIPAHQM